MSQLKEIEGRYYQEAEVVMLATDKKIKSINDLVLSVYNDLHIFTKNDGQEYGKITKQQHLYIVSNEEIKEGDWFLEDDRDNVSQNDGIPNWVLRQCTHIRNSWIFYNINEDIGCNPDWSKKIIATTDESLHPNASSNYTRENGVEGLARPSDSFIKKYIEEYNKGNVITNVLVEYEIGKSYSGNSGLEIKQWLKVDSNNYITIKKVEPELYTREEVKILLQKSLLFAFKEGNNHIGSNLPFLRTIMDNWIKKNLKYKKAKH